MYGDRVQEKEEEIPEQPKTPASTSLFVRSVRNFGGPRFRRSVLEGYIEDLLIEENQEQLQGEEVRFLEIFSSFSCFQIFMIQVLSAELWLCGFKIEV